MIEIPQKRREQAHRAFRVLVVIMIVSSIPAGLTAAQTDDEPSICTVGPPIRGEYGDGVDLEVMFVNDNSPSMGFEGDNNESRLSVLKESIAQFIFDAEDSDEFGHVDIEANLLHILSDNHESVNQSVQNLQADANDQYEGQAISAAADELQTGTNATDNATKAIIYVTDGTPDEPTAGIDAANQARDNGIVVYAVGIGVDVDEQYMIDVAGDESRYFDADTADLVDVYSQLRVDVENVERGIRIETRDLYKPGSTHPYTVREFDYDADGDVVDSTDVTDTVTLDIESAYNGTLLTTNDNATMTAVDDENVSDWARIDTTYNGSSGCTNVVVSGADVEHIEILPGIWRLNALVGDGAILFIILSTLGAVAAARFTSAFGGLAIGQMVMTVGWFGGYVSWAFAATSLFVALFIGLNLAANIDYSVGRFER